MIDTDSEFSKLVNTTLPELKTGIDKLKVKKELIVEEDVKNGKLMQLIKLAKEHPGEPQTTLNRYTEDVINVIFEDGNIFLKTLVAIHKNLDGSEVEISLHDESDGTRRLIEYLPLLYAIIQKSMVYVVDEIERSIHPIMIKDIIRKLSESEMAKGQLIFTTHESGLLDQSIFRPDEIWFAQKDAEQATQLYPLSDYNIHKTANIENGYLIGRYGGIPFLSNLKDLHW
jgi:AAA15 family ATPase/GTPase